MDTLRTNNITHNLVDPRSKEPDLKFAAVAVEKVVSPKKKIVIVGAGAAGLGFIKTYRTYNQTDEIHVFSREIHPFYNRVMLPDYVSGTQTWEQLQKTSERELYEWNVKIHNGLGVKKLDTSNKTITDDHDQNHNYDVLILGTGSRAFMPKDVPTHLKGISNMRTRHHADDLLNRIGMKNWEKSATEISKATIGRPLENNEKSVVIVGGGLLGLEMAASLREIGVRVTVVQRISRLWINNLTRLPRFFYTKKS
ncbi:MAG: FAD-dependent oxidoreductase [Saprospiraceae bacterium]|nr:FAD-dependent oxidoreductase [Saprospiraceae bacterium]